MTKSWKVLGVSLVFAVGTLMGTGAPASADTPRCATYKEFRQIDMGMTRARVRQIFDISGQFAGGHAGGYTRYYGSCRAISSGGGDGGAGISYDGRNNRVVEKRWSGYR